MSLLIGSPISLCTLQEIKGCYIISQSVYPGTNDGDLLGADIKVRIDSCISAVDKEAKLAKSAAVADKLVDVGMCLPVNRYTGMQSLPDDHQKHP